MLRGIKGPGGEKSQLACAISILKNFSYTSPDEPRNYIRDDYIEYESG
jgi:hypothetical protein